MLLSACGDYGNTGADTVALGSSELIGAEVIEDVNTSVMLQVVQANINPSATNAFGYKAVKISYKTKGQNDEDVNASGLLVIPTASDEYKSYLASMGKSFSVSMICDNHGTIFTNAEAPSNVEVKNGLPDYALGVSMTGYAGFAAIFPDYIGYGDSNDVAHPYLLKKASAQASEDMIKVSIRYMEEEGVALNYQLFISGYSQGGYTAMALAQKVEEALAKNVNVMGVAPMAGPYDLEAMGDKEIDASHTMVYPAFLGYLADSYSYYNDNINISDVLALEETSTFHELFNGSKSAVEIHYVLGLTNSYGFAQYTADALFSDSFMADYQNSTDSTLRTELIANSVDDWTPRTKLNLIHCADDEIIPFSITQNTYNNMSENGADVTLTQIPTAYLSQQQDADNPFIHANCATEAYGTAIGWFSTLRSGE
jgi:predicted esterase